MQSEWLGCELIVSQRGNVFASVHLQRKPLRYEMRSHRGLARIDSRESANMTTDPDDAFVYLVYRPAAFTERLVRVEVGASLEN